MAGERTLLTRISEGTNFPDLDLKVLSQDDFELVPSVSSTPVAEKAGYYPIATGGYADVYKALFKREPGATKQIEVVIKVIRGAHLDADNDEKMAKYIKRIRREYGVWGILSHPNVVQLEGIVIHNALPSAGLVSEYKPCMDLLHFMKRCKDFDRVSMVQGIACGLAYLHENLVIHGDLTTSNILVDKSVTRGFVPLISDFGKSRILEVTGCTTSMGDTPTLSRPPEFLDCDSEEEITNKSVMVSGSDVYSMSLIFIEVLTGKKAYSEEKRAEYKIVGSILKSQLRPTRDKYPMLDRTHDYIWPIMEDCWKSKPSDRISSAEAYARLCQIQTQPPLQPTHNIN